MVSHSDVSGMSTHIFCYAYICVEHRLKIDFPSSYLFIHSGLREREKRREENSKSIRCISPFGISHLACDVRMCVFVRIAILGNFARYRMHKKTYELHSNIMLL